LRRAELGKLVANEHQGRGVPMNTDLGKVRRRIRAVALAGAYALVLGSIVFGAAASSLRSRRDVHVDTRSEAIATVATETGGASKESRTASFVNRTNVVEYPLHLDSATEVVRLSLSVEVEHGLVRWELTDPTGAVRSKIRTTGRARMEDTELTGMQGKWVLRMNFEDATGRYHVSWSR
jgi:hypothetical protein